MISMTAGSASAAAMVGPIAVRSIARRRPSDLLASESVSLIAMPPHLQCRRWCACPSRSGGNLGDERLEPFAPDARAALSASGNRAVTVS
jgi:hypothetical protein